MLATKLARSSSALLPARRAAPQRAQTMIRGKPCVLVRASQEPQGERTLTERLALPAAALLGAALLFAGTPDAAEAARSGGRVGGSAGFSQRRSAPAPAPRSAPAVTNNYYAAPSVGFGMPFFGGWGFGMPFFPGYGFGFGFGLSSIFNMFILFFMISIVWNVISNFTNPARKDNNTKSDDEW